MSSGWWFAEFWASDPSIAVSWVVWVIVSVVLHELAHGWAAIRLGDRTPIEMGRMTWNPLVHMGRTSLIAFAIIGIAWGAMPVNPSRLRGRYADALVSAAGPAMNLALALLLMLAGGVWLGRNGFQTADPLNTNLLTFFWVGASLNVFLMLFNLLPIPPFDGSRILGSVSPGLGRLLHSEQARMGVFVLFAVMFFWGAQYIFQAAFTAGSFGIGIIARIVG